MKGDAEGLLLAVIDLNVAEHSLTIGIVIDFSISPLLELRIPVEALFDTDTPEQWHIFIGKYPDPIRANILEVFTGTGYLMLVGDAQHDAANLPSNLPGTTGFVIATGLHVSMLWGSKTIRLYAELAAGFDALLGFSPLLVAGKLYVRGELCLFIISISAHAELDVRLGKLPDEDSGYRIHGELCGSIDLFFFKIEGCVDFTLEDNSPPEIAIPDLVGGVAIVNRSPALVHGTATDGPVDACARRRHPLRRRAGLGGAAGRAAGRGQHPDRRHPRDLVHVGALRRTAPRQRRTGRRHLPRHDARRAVGRLRGQAQRRPDHLRAHVGRPRGAHPATGRPARGPRHGHAGDVVDPAQAGGVQRVGAARPAVVGADGDAQGVPAQREPGGDRSRTAGGRCARRPPHRPACCGRSASNRSARASPAGRSTARRGPTLRTPCARRRRRP